MPKYLCRLGPSDTPSEVDAFDEEEAAETFAEGVFADDIELPEDVNVLVDDVAYTVTIKAVPKFSASKKNDT